MRQFGWLCCCAVAMAATFGPGREVGRLPAVLNEASGLAASRVNTGVLWVHNDSGDQARVFAVALDGRLLGTYRLAGAGAADWEDMGVGPAPGGGSYLYMADIGDNNAVRESIRVYRVAEPRVDAGRTAAEAALNDVTSFEFVYEDGARDAESFFVDPLTDVFYVVTKREVDGNRLYRSVAARAGDRNTLERTSVTFRFTGATGADISADGLQILIRRYSSGGNPFTPAAAAATYWIRGDASTSVEQMLAQPGQIVALVVEQQGEAIAFAPDGQGFYTTTEGAEAPLTFYPADRGW